MTFFKREQRTKSQEIALLATTEKNAESHELVIDISTHKEETKGEYILEEAKLQLPKPVLATIFQYINIYELAHLGLSPLGRELLLKFINQTELERLIATGFAELTSQMIKKHIASGMTVYEQHHPKLTKTSNLFNWAFWTIMYIALGIGFPGFIVYMCLFTEHPGAKSHKNNEPAFGDYLITFTMIPLWWLTMCVFLCLGLSFWSSQREQDMLNDEARGMFFSKNDPRIKAVCDYVGIQNKTIAELQEEVLALDTASSHFPAFFKKAPEEQCNTEASRLQI